MCRIMRMRRILREKGMCTEFYKRHSRARESSCGNSRRKNRKERKNDKLSWPKNCTFVERAYIYMYRRSDKSKKWENGEPTQPRDNRSFRTFCENNSCDFFRRLRARARVWYVDAHEELWKRDIRIPAGRRKRGQRKFRKGRLWCRVNDRRI